MKTKLIEIFKAGTHIAANGTKIDFSEADVEDIAASYNPDLHEAPIVIGHPKDNGPAFGWIKKLVCQAGNKILQAMPAQLNADFVEAVNSGAYKKISASIYTKESPNNPTPGHFYLRHVGFLGAQPPAIKGLKAVEFAESDQTVDVELDFSETDLAYNNKSLSRILRNLKNFLIGKYSQEEADSAIPEWDIEGISETATKIISTPEPTAKAEFAEESEPVIHSDPRTAELAALLEDEKKKRTAAETELSRIALEKKQTANAEFCEARIKEGRLLPAQKDKILQILNNLSTSKSNLEFAEDDTVASLKQVLSSLPVQVNFSEAAPTETPAEDLSDLEDLANAAKKYRAEQAEKGNNISFAEAVRTVKG